jgi:hypothetical protein
MNAIRINHQGKVVSSLSSSSVIVRGDFTFSTTGSGLFQFLVSLGLGGVITDTFLSILISTDFKTVVTTSNVEQPLRNSSVTNTKLALVVASLIEYTNE